MVNASFIGINLTIVFCQNLPNMLKISHTGTSSSLVPVVMTRCVFNGL